MINYISDGKKLLDVEYDAIPQLSDTIDGMMIIGTDRRSAEEYAVFLQEPNGSVTCYVLDEVFIVGRVSGFENLIKAAEAWRNDEI
jgi:hypothetical protein